MDEVKEYKISLEKRIFEFAVCILKFLKKMQYSIVNKVIINQLAKSATSIGANFEEAQGASSKKDFLMKMAIAHRESKETNYWLRIIKETDTANSHALHQIIDESKQIRNILGSIVGKVRRSISQ